jgi:hypothetical protein
MFWRRKSTKQISAEVKSYLAKINSLENIATKFVASHSINEAFEVYLQILSVPKPDVSSFDEYQNQLMEHKLSKIRFQLEKVKIREF